MLRIHFSFADLSRVSIAESADRGTETVLSLHVAASRGSDIRFRRWWGAARRFTDTEQLLQLCTPKLLPGFAMHAVESDWRDTRAEAYSADPQYRRLFLQRLADHRPVTPFGIALTEDDRRARWRFAEILGGYQKDAIDAWMPQIDTLVTVERNTLSRLAAVGAERLLTNLHQDISWDPPVLSIPSAVDLDVHLDGAGMLIQPSVFARGRPWLGGFDAPGCRPVLNVPLRRQPPLGDHEPLPPHSVIALLGRTRATILRAIADTGPHTTGQLARLAGCSPATVSDHATVLRNSGLIITVRDGQRVRHIVTELGAVLVDSGGGAGSWS